MIYESSYETGRIPFVPNVNRGHWAKTTDFIYASLALSHRMDISLLFMSFSHKLSITSLLPGFVISLVLYTVPLLMVQSFMGQFSSSGFISAFRISPLFKGLGYVSLVLNILMLIFASVFAIIPLVYLVSSLNPTLPWSCDGTYSDVSFCKPKIESNEPLEYMDFLKNLSSKSNQIPSLAYFDNIFHSYKIYDTEITISLQMVIASICIWLSIALVIYKIRNIGKLGQLIRYSVQIILFVVVVLIARLIFFLRSSGILADIFVPNLQDIYKGLSFIPNYGLFAFGSGCGLILTLASFNKFNTNIRQTSWWIGIGHVVTIMLFSILEVLLKASISSKLVYAEYYLHRSVEYLVLYVMGGSVFAEMAWPNLWSILFYFMLTLAGCTLLIIQITVILKSIFDEFINLRRYETRISLSFTAVVALASLFLSSLRGHQKLFYLRGDSLVTQSLIDLLVILAVLWVYGRQRFQRDLEFMIGERFANWKIFALRFLAPLVLLITLAQGLLVTIFSFYRLVPVIYSFMLRPLPWLCVPVYAIHCLLKSRGSFKSRLIKSCRPTDWHPVELEDRQRYESLLNTTNMTHPLNVLEDEENT